MVGGAILLSAVFIFLIFFWRADLDTMLARLRGQPVALAPAIYDLGSAAEGQTKAFEVRLLNYSMKPVRIIGGSSSCSCTVIDELPLTVPSGGETTVSIRARFVGTPGRFQHKYVLYTDSHEESSIVGQFFGFVRDP